MADYRGDCFYDCNSESENGDEDSVIEHEPKKCEQIIRAVGGFSTPNFDDPLEIRQTLERVSDNSRLLLRSVGGKCDCLEHSDRHTSATFFYPATLEICARLLTDKSSACPASCRCRVRSEPVKLQLPMELNPYSGQVNMKIFQHALKAMTVVDGCYCAGAGDKRQPNAEPGTKTEKATSAKITKVPEADPGGGADGGFEHPLAPRSGAGLGSGFGFTPGGLRRYTQRHNYVHKSGRKVRWPDIL
ncbi:uncharacterized protein LOC132785919 [Drosophila nasuta]|uniref:uncharacterized protein LOC132785919 n=1 Tax=Drosophila nasuta TaxID=42062 RepID=UPI00295F2D59|nr:uncharacterized protein LOC132785919 [Drosophila nasuta]